MLAFSTGANLFVDCFHIGSNTPLEQLPLFLHVMVCSFCLFKLLLCFFQRLFIRSRAGEILHFSPTVDEVLFELLLLRVAQMLRLKLEVYNKVHTIADPL